MADLSSRIQAAAQDLAPRLASMRHELHRHPELSGCEFWTTSRLREWLTETGIDVLPLPLKTGLVAEVRGAKPGPVVALRADIDALPVQEETGLPYASEIPGQMHACGHDMHMAVMLGAAFVLKQMAPELPGTVRLLFQPAEEISEGALPMIRAGVLEGVRAVFGCHNKPDVAAGQAGIKAGPLMAAVDTLKIEVTGKGGHGAIPESTVDPIVAASAIVMALQTAVSRNTSPLEAAVISICSFQAGTASNVIPPSATLLGTMRSFNPAVRVRLQELVQRITRDVATAYGARAEMTVTAGPPAVTNDPAMADLMRAAAATQGIPVVEAVPTMGGEDFAEYQARVPGCFAWLGTGRPENWHHPRFTVDDNVLPVGAAFFAQVAVDALVKLGQ